MTDHKIFTRQWWSQLPPWAGAATALLALLIGTVLIERLLVLNPGESSNFLKLANLINVLRENSEMGVIAVGMTLVIILGGIDLSVGSLLALAGGLGVLAMNRAGAATDSVAIGVSLGVMTMLLVGGLAGLLNGVLVAYGRVASFIATLGALVAYRSVARWLAEGGQFRAENPLFTRIGQGLSLPFVNVSTVPDRFLALQLPYALLVFGIVALAGHVLLNHMRIGRYIIAIGANERAARYSAIGVKSVTAFTFALLGVMTGLAALVHASRFESVNSAQSGLLMELDVIAAVVVGGTSMRGGSGSVLGTVFGVLIVAIIKNIMPMLGVPSRLDGLVMGVIIIMAVLLQRKMLR